MPTRFSAGLSTSARLANIRLPVTVTSALSERCSTTSRRTFRRGRDVDLPARAGKIDQRKRRLVMPGRHLVEPERPLPIRHRQQRCPGCRTELHRDSRQRAAGFVSKQAGDGCRLRDGVRSHQAGTDRHQIAPEPMPIRQDRPPHPPVNPGG